MILVEANGVELACEQIGDAADPAVLLIAGLGVQMIRWTDQFCGELAARGYRVIRFDNRDAGCSTHLSHCPPPAFSALAAASLSGEPPLVPYTLADLAADAVGLLDGLGVERAHVVGRSMGGLIAQVMASEHAERVASLTSIMSSTGNPALPQAAPDVMAMMMRPAPDPRTDAAAFLSHSVAFARRIAGTGFPFDEAAHRRLVLEEVARAYDPAGVGRQMGAIAVGGDRRSRLATITAPSLVIHGDEDPLVPAACGADTAASIAGAEFLLIGGMGHDLPQGLNKTVTAAIDRTARRAA